MILAKLLLWMAQLSLVEIHSSGYRIDGLVQERRNSIANALELRLSCTNLSIYRQYHYYWEPYGGGGITAPAVIALTYISPGLFHCELAKRLHFKVLTFDVHTNVLHTDSHTPVMLVYIQAQWLVDSQFSSKYMCISALMLNVLLDRT